MSKKLLTCTWIILIGVVVLVTVALIIGRRPAEEPEIETMPEETVKAVIVEEETSEEVIADTAADILDRVVVVTEAETTTEGIRSAEELANMVLNAGLNGADREAFLGERYEEVQAWIDANYEPPTHNNASNVLDALEYSYPSGDVLNPEDGINYYYGTLETYYDLDMSWNVDVMRGMGFDAENYPYWVRGDGVKMLGDYVMCAADFDYEPRGTITETSLGTAIVVDTGAGGWAWHDICVSGW